MTNLIALLNSKVYSYEAKKLIEEMKLGNPQLFKKPCNPPHYFVLIRSHSSLCPSHVLHLSIPEGMEKVRLPVV